MKKLLAFAGLLLGTMALDGAVATVIEPAFHHLGDNVVKNWPEAPADPAGFELTVRFSAHVNDADQTLGLTHRDVDDRWSLVLNEKPLGELKRKKERREYLYDLPAGSLREGENVLRIIGRRTKDDMTVGNVTIYDASIRELLRLQTVEITVVDAADGRPLPAKLTFADQTNGLVEVYYAAAPTTAVRPGIVYTLGGPTKCALPPGGYRVYASRGTEWSLREQPLVVTDRGAPSLKFELRREVDTTGLVAADTHIHTVTFSGHGDASVEERMVTLAAEGVELAVATDHNHQTDYRPYQARLGLDGYFTSVTGNEVTTQNGHFNSFPLPSGKDIPAYREADWVKLVGGIRAKGAKVVILNHPRWPDIARGPFGRFGLNRASGERASGGPFTFDALELINSGTLQPDPLFLCHDWFALLNHGARITAVGSSDSHTVGNVVGQGRTYVPSRTDAPGNIDVDAACAAFLGGRTSISMGILAQATVNGRFAHGDLAPIDPGPATVELRVQSPSWVRPERVHLFVNGQAVVEADLPAGDGGQPTDVRRRFQLPRLTEDGWLVCVVLGPGVRNPAWATEENYTFAATNPIYLDVDGDGRCATPRETATARLKAAGNDLEKRWQAVMDASDPVAVQMVAQMRLAARPSDRAKLDERIRTVAADRRVFGEFLRYAPAK